jgi:hypothetical protein
MSAAPAILRGMSEHLTPRGKALHWASSHRGLTEQPAGSNTDNRRDGIRAAQIRCANGGSWLIGEPWCGVWVYNALHAAEVVGISSRMASVSLIETDAKKRRRPYRGWASSIYDDRILRGDAVILFGPGIHVELLREVDTKRGVIVTDGGNTSSGSSGSQANGGGSFRRVRPFHDVYGVALINYPG